MLTHGLLPEEKLEKVRRELGTAAATKPAPPAGRSDGGQVAALQARIAELEAEVADLRRRLGDDATG
jgi:uncharacterized protein YceH (UPF0502 family)